MYADVRRARGKAGSRPNLPVLTRPFTAVTYSGVLGLGCCRWYFFCFGGGGRRAEPFQARLCTEWNLIGNHFLACLRALAGAYTLVACSEYLSTRIVRYPGRGLRIVGLESIFV